MFPCFHFFSKTTPTHLYKLCHKYFFCEWANGLLLNWREFEKLDKIQKINTLSMISPVTNEEKQKLLEAITTEDKINTLESIISFYLHETGLTNQTIQ